MVAAKLSAVLKAVPLGKVASPQAMTEGVCYRKEAFHYKPKPPCRGLRGGFGHRKENNMKKQRKSS